MPSLTHEDFFEAPTPGALSCSSDFSLDSTLNAFPQLERCSADSQYNNRDRHIIDVQLGMLLEEAVDSIIVTRRRCPGWTRWGGSHKRSMKQVCEQRRKCWSWLGRKMEKLTQHFTGSDAADEESKG